MPTAEKQGQLAANGEGHLVDIDPDQPWASWPSPSSYEAKVTDIRVAVDDLEAGAQRLVLEDQFGQIGYPSRGGLQNISTRVGFPMPFVEKLPLRLQAEVINARLQDADETTFSMVQEPYEIVEESGARRWSDRRLVTNIAPGWRGVLPHADVCQQAFNIMADVYGRDGLRVKEARRLDSSMRLTVLSPQQRAVTPQLGDVLSLGVTVEHQYGVELLVRLFAERLVCLNGMTALAGVFDWKSRQMGSAAHQLDWVTVGVAEAIGAFDGLVESAAKMAAVRVDGDPERMLLERASVMRLPAGLRDTLLQMYREEPVPTEWGMLNAFTRLATHGEVSGPVGRRIREAAGDWARGFDMVTARLPRPMAEAVGAHIIDESPLALEA